jgi:hypothetical protein
MLDANLPRISTAFIQILLTAALALPVTRLHAQDAAVIDGPPGYQVACSIQSASGNGTCGGVPAEASCNAEGGFGSQPSTDSTGIAFVYRGDLPVKVYWLNFQGTRVLYNPYLAPGDQQQQQTYVGHNWLVTTLADQCIGIFQASSADNGAAGSDGTEGTNESVSVPPPELPTYDQSPPPDDNLVWIGRGVPISAITTGCPPRGPLRPRSDIYGRRAIGLRAAAGSFGMRDIGVRTWAFTAASITASAITAGDMSGVPGRVGA